MPEIFSLPGYEILEKIGEGGTSSVWKARQLSLDRLVAIKTLDPAIAPDPDTLIRFRQEAQAAARLKHPSIVQLFDAGEAAGRPYMIMEYVDGCTVGDLLRRSGTLVESNALLVAEAVAHALAYAWDKDCIIHLDIKPDNVLVENDGAIKVADLGLARYIGLHRRRTDSGMIIGTPNYVSPEQAQGVEDLDCRTDIYSLGAMLYHLVTGRLPFAGYPGSSAMDAHVTEFLPDPVIVQPELSPATAWLIEKMMVKDRAYRPTYWSVVLADLAEVKQGRLPKPPLPVAGQSTVQRHPLRQEPVPAGPEPDVEEPPAARRKIVINEAEATRAGQQRFYLERGLGRAFSQLLFLTLGAAAVGLFFYLGLPQRIGFRAAALPVPDLAPAAPVAVRTLDVVEENVPAPDVTWDDLPAAEPEQGMKNGVVVWENADFKEGARLFNDAYARYIEFQKTRANRDELPMIEQKAREAITRFENARALAPPDVDVPDYIQRCFHLIADVRHSTLLQPDPPARPATRPALPAPPTSVQ